MTYTMSPNIAVYAKDIKQARDFYVETLGFEEIPTSERWIHLKSGPNELFLMTSSAFSGAVHELFVDDLERARTELVSKGCEIIRWEGKGQDCYIKDPCGVFYNIWEQ